MTAFTVTTKGAPAGTVKEEDLALVGDRRGSWVRISPRSRQGSCEIQYGCGSRAELLEATAPAPAGTDRFTESVG